MAQSHDDRDLTGIFESMAVKANRLTEQGLNRITAGFPGEKPLYEETIGKTLVRRLPDDEHCDRISIGGGGVLEGHGQYVVFRGKPSSVLQLLKTAIEAIGKAHESPDK